METKVSFELILYPVADSHVTDVGLHYAIALARSYNAKLLVLTCRSKASARTGETENSMRAGVKTAIEDSFVMFQTNDSRLDWEFIVVESNRPAATIKMEAEQKNIDLIVMSARRQPHAVVLLGSTAESVCRSAPTAPCPVMVVRPLKPSTDETNTN
jgi:nucleotide-binding universal stress UspA family protein